MSESLIFKRLHRVLGGRPPGGVNKERTSRARRFTGLECLEGRAVPATINASGVISATAAGADTNYTITLSSARSSDSGIGTFWFAWVPGEDFLATSPISVSPPSGWTDNITNMGPGDGFAVQFLANSPANDVQPGSSLNFSFRSADPPAAVNGNSTFFPGTPVETSFVYPAGPFSDAGHQFVVTPATGSTPTPSPTPPVTVVGIQEVKNRKHQVTEIVVDLSGPVNAARADSLANYQLKSAGRNGSFTARNSPVVRLRSAAFDAATNTVTLAARKPFALAKPVQLTIDGTSPSGLQDTTGQLIDGDGNGTAGGNAVAVIRHGVVTLNPVASALATPSRPSLPARSASHRVAPPIHPVAPLPTPSGQPVASPPTLPAPPTGFPPFMY